MGGYLIVFCIREAKTVSMHISLGQSASWTTAATLLSITTTLSVHSMPKGFYKSRRKHNKHDSNSLRNRFDTVFTSRWSHESPLALLERVSGWLSQRKLRGRLPQPQGLHRHSGPHPRHLSGLLEDGVGAEHLRHRHDHASLWKRKSKKMKMTIDWNQVDLFFALQPKCDLYWPDAGSETYGELVVTLVREDVLSSYTLRTFTIRNLKVILPYNQC